MAWILRTSIGVPAISGFSIQNTMQVLTLSVCQNTISDKNAFSISVASATSSERP